TDSHPAGTVAAGPTHLADAVGGDVEGGRDGGAPLDVYGRPHPERPTGLDELFGFCAEGRGVHEHVAAEERVRARERPRSKLPEGVVNALGGDDVVGRLSSPSVSDDKFGTDFARDSIGGGSLTLVAKAQTSQAEYFAYPRPHV